MKHTKILAGLLVLVMMLSCMLAACAPQNETSGTSGSTTGNVTTGNTTPDNTTSGSTEELLITVEPAQITMYAGEDIVLLFGVSVNNTEASLVVSDDGDFDADTPGTYTITYTAKLNGASVTAKRTIVVLEPLSDVAVQIQIDNLKGTNKWNGTDYISFANKLYMELSADTTLGKNEDGSYISGIFKNTADKDIVLTVAGSHGSSAIIDKNGVVIEGRDGANSKLVNAENPDRAGSATKTMVIDGESVSVSDAFARNMIIPAGGYALVVQTGYAGDGFDFDGRGFVAQNIINKYGNVMRIYWVDSNEELTDYVDQAPAVSGNSNILVAMGDTEFVLNDRVLAGLTVTDDNGTFVTDDDITYGPESSISLEIVDGDGFDVNVAGVYTVKLKATDAKGNVREFTRTVTVDDEGVGSVIINGNKMDVSLDNIAVDKDLASVGTYAFIVYTPDYKGEISYSNGWGIAFVLNEYGEIQRIYDGTTGLYFDAENPDGVKRDDVPKDYLTLAFASLQEGESLIVAPNSSTNNAAGGSRKYLSDNRNLGATVSVSGVEFETRSKIITVGDKSYTAAEGKWLYNTAIVEADAAKYSLLIFNTDFEGEFTTNGWGIAIVLDKYGTLVKIYDGAWMGFYTVDGKSDAALTFDAKTYAVQAFKELQEGETLIICVNDGGANESRAFAKSLYTYCGQRATLSGMTFEEAPVLTKTVTVGDKSYTAAEGKWLYNTEVAKADAAKYGLLIFDKSFEGTVEINGWGAALVLDRYGVLVKLYDGANGGVWTADGKSALPEGCTTANYATYAFEHLQDGETLVICPNDGTNAADSSRTFALSLRDTTALNCPYCGKTVALTGFTFEQKEN